MERSNRLFNCQACHCQVIICSSCDRGHIYCSSLCSESAYKASRREAGRRYQQTFRGRCKHAQRQQRYRAQQRKMLQSKKVTHHGSTPIAPQATSKHVKNRSDAQGYACHFCGKQPSQWLRNRFLHYFSSKTAEMSNAQKLGP